MQQYFQEIPSIRPLLVVILNDPVVLIATLPIYVPIFFPVVTIAFTKSPVTNPLTALYPLAYVLGNPYLLTRHICLESYSLRALALCKSLIVSLKMLKI